MAAVQPGGATGKTICLPLKVASRSMGLVVALLLCAAPWSWADDCVRLISPPAATIAPCASYVIQGSACGTIPLRYWIEWAPGINASSGWTSAGIELAAGGTQPVSNGTLATWTPPQPSTGETFSLRLRVQRGRVTSTASANIHIEPDLISADWPRPLTAMLRTGVAPWRKDDVDNVLVAVPNHPLSQMTLEELPWIGSPTQRLLQPLGSGADSRPRAIGDVDGLPGEEIVVPMGPSVRVLQADGMSFDLPTFGWSANFSESTVTLADLDDDGRLEILAVGRRTGAPSPDVCLFVWRGDGSGFFVPIRDNASAFSLSFAPRIAVADIDQDGQKEIVVVGAIGSATLQLQSFSCEGFPRPLADVRLAGRFKRLAVATFDAQIGPTVMVATESPGMIYCLNSNGQMLPGWPRRHDLTSVSALLATDLNRDGKNDLIVVGTNGLSIFDAGDPAAERREDIGPGAVLKGSAVTADVTDDGLPEILTLAENTLEKTALLVAFGSQSGVMKTWKLLGRDQEVPVLNTGIGPLVTDLDQDGMTDIAVAYDVKPNTTTTIPTSSYVTVLRTTTPRTPAANEWPFAFANPSNNPVLTTLAEFVVTIELQGSGNGRVVSSPPAIDCGPICSAPVLAGQSITLTAEPEPGSMFRGWSGACSGTAECVLAPSADLTVTAEFDVLPPNAQREALLSLFAVTEGPQWEHSEGWLGPEGTEGDWYGVTVDPSTGVVVRLALPFNRLIGVLPPELAWLTDLEELDLSGNQLSGTLPSSLGELRQLRILRLRDNQFSGALPSTVEQWTQLEELDMMNNTLSGPLPASLWTLRQLQVLRLASNPIGGTLPQEVSGLESLRECDLSNMQLGGSLPSSLRSLRDLRSLSLANNLEISGPIPAELGALDSLESLALPNNRLSGPIPDALGDLTSLRSLMLYGNALTGEIPAALGRLSSLQSLDCGGNELTGMIPGALGQLSSLRFLDLRNNDLTGAVPPELGDLWNLENTNLSSNRLSSLPATIGRLARLRVLIVHSNRLQALPAELGLLTDLEYLSASRNLITELPEEIGNLAQLRWLYLEENLLAGVLPTSICRLGQLTSLYLRENGLQGSIPPEIANLGQLKTLFLSGNRLTGEIPAQITSLSQLVSLDLRWNALHTDDPVVRQFLTSKQVYKDWEGTQTVAPTAIETTAVDPTTVMLSWEPILYVANGGGYRIYYGPDNSPGTLWETTSSKYITSSTITGLTPGTTYSFAIEAVTQPHADNPNLVVSERSAAVTAITPD
jgi:Leucine-rich repeat (LRR) protein